MARAPGFARVKETPFVPLSRASHQTIMPYAVKPAAVATPWKDHQPVFFNRWAETLVADVSTPKSGTTPTPGFTMGDAQIASTVLKLDQHVLLRVYIKIGGSTRINTLIRDNGTTARTGDRGNTFMYLPYRIAVGNSYQFSLYNYTVTRGPVAGGDHGNQTGHFTLNRIAANSNELPISIWDTLASAAANPGDAVASILQFYWTPGDAFDLQFEYDTDEIT